MKNIREARKTEKGRALVSLGCYLVFFVIVLLMVSFIPKDTTIPDDYELGEQVSDTYSSSKILNNIYSFNYNINIDGREIIYSGRKFGERELFTVNNQEYYYDGINYYINDNYNFSMTTNPYLYYDFMDFFRLNKIINLASYSSRTEYQDDSRAFNYRIATDSIIKLLEGINTDILEVPNDINLYTMKDGTLKRIELDFSSYGKFKNICTNNFNIILEYSGFDNQEEIVNPMG